MSGPSPAVVAPPGPRRAAELDPLRNGRAARSSHSQLSAGRTRLADPVVQALVVVTAVVLALDTAAKLAPGPGALRGWLDVGLENNVPTAWSVLLLLTLSGRLWAGRALGRLWEAAALAVLLLAVDEWVGWHEHLRVPGEHLRSMGVALPTYAWVLPGTALAGLVVLAALPWLRSLPTQVRRRFALALGVFCAGALGVEAVTGVVFHMGGSQQLWAHLTSVEEALEMAGVLLAASALGPRRGQGKPCTEAPHPLSNPPSGSSQCPPNRVLDRAGAHLVATGRRDGLVFRGLDGRPALVNTFTVAWRKALTAVNGPDGLRLHDLRHSYASALIQAGESVKTVQVRMGHASAMVTLDVYGHLWPDSEERTRAAVDVWLAPAADSLRTWEAQMQVGRFVPDYRLKG